MMRNIFIIADRLHKTPKEIRESFTVEEFDHFLVHCQMSFDELRDGK